MQRIAFSQKVKMILKFFSINVKKKNIYKLWNSLLKERHKQTNNNKKKSKEIKFNNLDRRKNIINT